MSDISQQPVLVTGGTGFLGGRLAARLLAAGRRVRVMSRRPRPELEAAGAEVAVAELASAEAVAAACAGMGTVFHTAARVGVWGPRDEFFRDNVLGTEAVIAGCRRHGVPRLVHTSTPSVVYTGRGISGGDESLPPATRCPAAYPLTKVEAERRVLAADGPSLRTVALRPHLMWGVDDPHLIPRIVSRARAGRLRIVGTGRNRVDMVHVENAVDAHLLAEAALAREEPRAAGRAYFITNGEPVVLWDWVNGFLQAVGLPPVRRRVPHRVAWAAGALCEAFWRLSGRSGEPPMTRFVADELAGDHYFSIEAARRDLGYAPKISMAAGTEELIGCWRERLS